MVNYLQRWRIKGPPLYGGCIWRLLIFWRYFDIIFRHYFSIIFFDVTFWHCYFFMLFFNINFCGYFVTLLLFLMLFFWCYFLTLFLALFLDVIFHVIFWCYFWCYFFIFWPYFPKNYLFGFCASIRLCGGCIWRLLMSINWWIWLFISFGCGKLGFLIPEINKKKLCIKPICAI